MEQRLLLAFLLTGAVIFLSQYFLPKPTPPPVAQKKEEPRKDPQQPAGTPAAAPGGTPAAKAGETAPLVTAQQAEFPTFENDLYRIKFSNKGAVVLEWVLKAFKDADG